MRERDPRAREAAASDLKNDGHDNADFGFSCVTPSPKASELKQVHTWLRRGRVVFVLSHSDTAEKVGCKVIEKSEGCFQHFLRFLS